MGNSTANDVWMARATVYELLAMGLLVPRRELAEALASGEYAEAFDEAAGVCGLEMEGAVAFLEGYRGMDPDEAFHEARRQYTRLFVGEREPLVTPYVGVRAAQARGEKGLLFVGRESVAIERFMRRCGVAKDVAAGQINDPVDHIGTVCEFLEYLCLVNAHAVRPAETAEVREGDYEEFRAAHFSEYALWCADEIRKSDPSAFYLLIARMLELLAKDARRH